MSTPPILSLGPTLPEEVPWQLRTWIQNIAQKLGNHTQAFALQKQQIDALKAGSTTTITESGGGGGSGGGSSSPFIGQGLINDQSGETAYTTAPGDNGILLILNDASPVAVTLTTDAAPFYLIITNFGAGTATLTPSTGTVNGGASLSLLQNQTVIAACDSTNWATTAFFTPPANTPAVAHEWLNSYDAATGAFGQAQPAYSDLTGTPTLPATIAPVAGEFLTGYDAGTGLFSLSTPAGISVTITTAALTVTGTQGSMTFTDGILSAQVQAT